MVGNTPLFFFAQGERREWWREGEVVKGSGNARGWTMTHWNVTTGGDRRLSVAGEVIIRSLTDLETPAALLTRDLYFEGADVLHCLKGRFRFTFDGTREIEIGPGETLITYPGYRVTIESLESFNRLSYGVFVGDAIEDYLDAVGFFHGEHGKARAHEELLGELKGILERQTKGESNLNSVCLSILTDVLISVARDLGVGGNGFLGDAIRQIRANLKQGIVRLEPLCEQLHVSRAHLHSVFVHAGLEAPSVFIRNEQTRLVLRLLQTTRLPIADIAQRAGFISKTHFANFMRRMTGKSAREWRNG